MNPIARRRSPAALRRTAVHEAGHAVAAIILRLDCGEVSIIPDFDDRCAGYCICPIGDNAVMEAWERRGREYGADGRRSALRASAMQLLAGAAAERELLGRAGPGAADDLRRASWLVDDLTPADGDVGATLRRLERATAALVRRHRQAVDALASALLRHKQLAGSEVERIVREASAMTPTAFQTADDGHLLPAEV